MEVILDNHNHKSFPLTFFRNCINVITQNVVWTRQILQRSFIIHYIVFYFRVNKILKYSKIMSEIINISSDSEVDFKKYNMIYFN